MKSSKYFENSKPFIVHRLDKDTSGVLIIAKNRKFAQLFTSLFRLRKIHKTYLAIVYGKVNKSIKIMRDNLIYIEKNKKITQKAISNLKIIRSGDKYIFDIEGDVNKFIKNLFIYLKTRIFKEI